MRLLTINMNMFNLTVDNSFYEYLDEIKPDIAFVQECRYNRIDKEYNTKWSGNFEEPIDSRLHLTVALSKKKDLEKEDVFKSLKYDYTCVCIEYLNNRFAGVHLPLPNENKNEYDNLLLKLKESNSKIICGDFNANLKNDNHNFIENLLNNEEYIDLWKVGLDQKKAHYIDFNGNIKQAEAMKHLTLRTFVRNKHLDYILAKKDFLILNNIIIDFRTLAFTDHCGIILDFDIREGEYVI